MLNDIRLLLGLGARRLWPQLRYWGTFLGIDPQSHLLLRVYISLFWLAWLVALVFLSAHQAELLGRQLSRTIQQALLAALPVLIALAQVAYVVDRAFRCPIRLDAADRLWIAPSRIRVASLAIVNALRDGVPVVVVASASLTFIYVVLESAADAQTSWATAGWVALATGLLAYATHAVVWCAQAVSWRPLPFRARWVWLTFFFAIAIVWSAWPALATGSGQWLITLFAGAPDFLSLVVLGVVDVLLTIGGAALGGEVEWARVLRANRQRIERSRYGFLAGLFGIPSFERSERQSTILRSFRLPVTFGDRSSQPGLLFTRSFLTLWRLAPRSFVDPLLRSGVVGLALALIVRVANIGDPASWLLLFLLLLQGRQLGLARHLRVDRERVFMRQFVGVSQIANIGMWMSIPIGLSVLGSVVAMLTAPLTVMLPYVVLSMGVIMLIALCEVAEIHDIPLTKGIRMPYEYWVVLATIPMAWAGLATHSILIVCLAAAGTVAMGLFHLSLHPPR